ncbi:MAG: ABC transporter ATP-binding protein [Ignisphaera sp.]|uniref:ABC transporter ATP-binding protein n=1 Tax=Ignisphaera aggregans TaxID=334771 RepID=A0A7C4JL69_9CREN
MARVKLIEVVKRFGRVIAVDRVNIEVNDGEFFALLGPSGCGKTTTLRLIAGLEIPDEGEIWIDNKLVNYIHPKDRDIAMVFQNYALYPHMTIYENIAFPLITRKRELKLSDDEIKKRVAEISKLLQIEDLLDRKPSQLSGGQQQRVALARALVRKPKVWLLDEPLSNLDAKLRVVMRHELKRLQRELGITTIYVTHDQTEAMSMADRIAIMNKGKVLQIGTPDDLYLKPTDTFVATFIGVPPMNLLECDVEDKYDKVALDCKDFSHIIADQTIVNELRKQNTKKVYLGFRPEHIKISTIKEYEDSILANVVVVERLGNINVVHVNIGKSEEKLVRVIAPNDLKVDVGQQIYIRIDWPKIYLFDYTTLKAIA